MDFIIKEKPFSWNDNFSEVALEDFSMIQKDLSYVTAQSIGMALAKLELLEKQGQWKRTSEEKPRSTRHVIVADGAIISHYGYYLKPKDKWFTDWMCEKEIDAPMFWMDMPEPPKESLCGECSAKMVKGTEE